MKKISKLFLAFAASFMMFSCSSDEPGGGTPDSSKGDVYATLTLSLPQGSRAATGDWNGNTNSEDGFEVGNDSENKVGSVLVVIASKNETGGDYTYIAHSLAGAHSTSGSDNRPTYNVQFESQDLIASAGQSVYVFAFCNPTSQLIEDAKAKFVGGMAAAIGKIADGEIWHSNAFLMANSYVDDKNAVTLPSADDMANLYNKPERPFNLGIVEVSRVAARFDFKQTQIGDNELNVYPIYNYNNIEYDKDGNPIKKEDQLVGYVKMDGMALVNMANNYYFLPRVSADGTATDWTICGRETATNYVVSPNFAEKLDPAQQTFGWLTTNYAFNGLVQYGTDNSKEAIDFSTLTFEALSTSLGEDDDNNWEDKDNPTFDKTNYHIWRYLTENTIPHSGDNSLVNPAQTVGITTCVAFRGQIVPADDENGAELTEAMKAGNKLYRFQNTLYGDLEMVKNAVIKAPTSPMADMFETVMNIKRNELSEEDFNKAISALKQVDVDAKEAQLVDNDFAIYESTKVGETNVYYVFYLYRNRHFDNVNNNVMGPMEFGVVRNNIYKLKIDNVLEFGHPASPDKDPDPENPPTPDETPKTYFRLQVKVLPWVVRVNNIIL